LIINTTQCCHGAVQAIYETGAALLEAGVIPGADMTPEAALTKLSYVFSKDEWDLDTKRQMMMTNLRGELTLPHTTLVKEMELIEALARSLHLSSSEEMDQLKDVLFPSLICSAVKVIFNYYSLHFSAFLNLILFLSLDGRFIETGNVGEIRC
jgi:lysophospholipase